MSNAVQMPRVYGKRETCITFRCANCRFQQVAHKTEDGRPLDTHANLYRFCCRKCGTPQYVFPQ